MRLILPTLVAVFFASSPTFAETPSVRIDNYAASSDGVEWLRCEDSRGLLVVHAKHIHGVPVETKGEWSMLDVLRAAQNDNGVIPALRLVDTYWKSILGRDAWVTEELSIMAGPVRILSLSAPTHLTLYAQFSALFDGEPVVCDYHHVDYDGGGGS